jgi:hypothetical protein
MVAGQAITTTPVSKEYESNFDQIDWGEPRAKKGGRWRYDEASRQMVEIGADWTDAERLARTPTEELTYGNLPPENGEVINTRKRHREFMKRNGLAMRQDYDGCRDKLTKQRQDRFLGKDPEYRKESRELLGRALHESRSKKR